MEEKVKKEKQRGKGYITTEDKASLSNTEKEGEEEEQKKKQTKTSDSENKERISRDKSNNNNNNNNLSSVPEIKGMGGPDTCEPGELPLSWAEPLVEPLRYNELIKTREEVIPRTRTRSRSFCGAEALANIIQVEKSLVSPRIEKNRHLSICLDQVITKERDRSFSTAEEVPLMVWRRLSVAEEPPVILHKPRKGRPVHKKSRSTSGWESWSTMTNISQEGIHLSPEVISLSLEMSNKFFLENILQHEASCQVLMAFMKARHCHENLCFWLAVEDYKAAPTSSILKMRAEEIAEKFLTAGGELEINLSAAIMKETREKLKDPKIDCFESAQKAIFFLMVNGVFEYFLSSERFNYENERKNESQPNSPSSRVRIPVTPRYNGRDAAHDVIGITSPKKQENKTKEKERKKTIDRCSIS